MQERVENNLLFFYYISFGFWGCDLYYIGVIEKSRIMTKADLILNIMDYVERAEYSDDFDEKLQNSMENYLRDKYLSARVEETGLCNDEERKFYTDIVAEGLKNSFEEMKFPYYEDDSEDVDYTLKVEYGGDNSIVAQLYFGDDDKVMEDFVNIDGEFLLEDKTEAIVTMILFNKYC